MTVQYLRTACVEVCGLTVKGGGNDDLRIRFATRQIDTSTPNLANVIITNASPQTEARCVSFKQGDTLKLFAGYGGDALLLFSGEIFQVRAGREIDAVTDTYLHILARDGTRHRNYHAVNASLAAGHTFKDRVDLVTKELSQFGIGIGYICDLPNRKFGRNYVFSGMAHDLLREVCEATQTSWSVQNGQFQLIRNNEGMPGGTVVLNSNTGLIGRPTQTQQGIEGVCLLNGRLRPGGLVQIDQKSIERAALNPANASEKPNALIQNIAADGIYKLFVVEHEGDTRGQPFYTNFIGIRNGDPISSALASRGIDTDIPGDTGNTSPGDAPPPFTDPGVKAGPR